LSQTPLRAPLVAERRELEPRQFQLRRGCRFDDEIAKLLDREYFTPNALAGFVGDDRNVNAVEVARAGKRWPAASEGDILRCNLRPARSAFPAASDTRRTRFVFRLTTPPHPLCRRSSSASTRRDRFDSSISLC
jgi:hypothetical protein